MGGGGVGRMVQILIMHFRFHSAELAAFLSSREVPWLLLTQLHSESPTSRQFQLPPVPVLESPL